MLLGFGGGAAKRRQQQKTQRVEDGALQESSPQLAPYWAQITVAASLLRRPQLCWHLLLWLQVSSTLKILSPCSFRPTGGGSCCNPRECHHSLLVSHKPFLPFANGSSIKFPAMDFLDCAPFPSMTVTDLIIYLTHLLMSSNVTSSTKAFLDPCSLKNSLLPMNVQNP